MRLLDVATAAYLSDPVGVISRPMVHVTARGHDTDATEALGLWQGDDTLTVALEGVQRSYHGAGSLVAMEPMRAGIGLDVRMVQITLNNLTPEVEQLLRAYDPRLAPAEIHRALLSPQTRQLVAEPTRLFRGWVEAVMIRTPEAGGTGEAQMTLASAARGLTRGLTLTRSQVEMQRRQSADAFRTYGDVAGQVGVWWGEKREQP